MVEKLEMQTKDLSQEKIRMIGELFPNCITESKEGEKTVLSVDFDALKQELSDSIVEGTQERYQFTWPDKSKAKRLANTPTTMTLRPYRNRSVNFDDTKNLYIEGDNLEVLKILRETYLGKIKMIYIDPPYNTGNDFVYNDNYSMSKVDYFNINNSTDEDGNLLYNPISNGRFHTDWLNMIYPRILLSKDLLSEEGLIFISINQSELINLSKICDEIFGSINFISLITWESKSGGSADEKYVVDSVEYVLIYAKNKHMVTIGKQQVSPDDPRYKNRDQYYESRGPYLLKKLDYRMTSLHYTDSLNYPIIAPDGIQVWPGGESYRQEGGWNWRWSKKKVDWGIENGFIEFVKKNGKWVVNSKQYLFVDNNCKQIDRSIPYRNLITSDFINTTQGSKTIVDYYGSKIFEYSKPVKLLDYLMDMADVSTGDIVLDYFSGSATTGHSVLKRNKEKGSDIQFICVQLPEKCDENSSAFKYGFTTICDLAIDRLKKTISELGTSTDGFRVLGVDTSNMKESYYVDNVDRRTLEDYIDFIKPGRNGEDILIQVMLELGIELSSKIEQKNVMGHAVFSVDDDYLVACFDDSIDDSTVINISKEMSGCMYAVFYSGSSMSDEMLSNIEQIFKTYSPQTKIRII